jgi:hypothetical protein
MTWDIGGLSSNATTETTDPARAGADAGEPASGSRPGAEARRKRDISLRENKTLTLWRAVADRCTYLRAERIVLRVGRCVLS